MENEAINFVFQPIPLPGIPQEMLEVLPSFERIDDALVTFQTEMAKLRQMLKALAIIRGMNDQFLAVVRYMDQRFTRIDQRFARIEISYGVFALLSLQNADLRQQNSYCTSAHDGLLPLSNVRTGEEIHPFPATGGELQRWTGPMMRTVLEALGAAPPARMAVDALRLMLRTKIGLRRETVEAA
ncbi:MAG: hypothetical protein M1826_003452 [Phylliscum demangeonii]|nr:MAG: hypothetical protein M1826_003452 [Phylliscum demangeonii]